MGFPKPWPTEWPESEPQKPEKQPSPPTEEPDEEPAYPIPELRHDFHSVTWAVVHACNLKCTHCYDVVPYHRSDLDTRRAHLVIDRLSSVGVDFVAFSGGELFIRKDLFALMSHCKELGMRFSARSNGTLIVQAAATRLRNLGISVVGISFDGATRETHDAVRGLGSFDAALSGLKCLIAEGIRVQMEVVLSRKNAHEALNFIDLGQSVEVDEVNFSTMAPRGRGLQRLDDLLDHDLWLHLTSLLRGASKGARVVVSPNCAFAGPCVANIEPHITCDGWVTPCYLSDLKLFHILETPQHLIRQQLFGERDKCQDICGRRAWTEPAGAKPRTEIALETGN